MRLLQYLESSLRKGISPFRYNAASSVYFTFSIPRCLAMEERTSSTFSRIPSISDECTTSCVVLSATACNYFLMLCGQLLTLYVLSKP